MDNANVQLHHLVIKDEVGLRCQKLFREFLDEYDQHLQNILNFHNQIILFDFLFINNYNYFTDLRNKVKLNIRKF